MGAVAGTVSYMLYRVEGERPESWKQAWMERIEEFAFRPLTPESEEDTSLGWCVLGELLNTSFTLENVLRGEYLCLSQRVDRWALPPALLKARIAERADQVQQEHQLHRLSRLQKDQVREVVMREMKAQSLPVASSVDMVWNLDTNTLRFWSQSGTAIERFLDLFESTFGLRLVPCSAYVAAVNVGLSDALIGELATVEQAVFVDFEEI